MSDFKAKIHQILSRLGLRPRPRWGSLQRSPEVLLNLLLLFVLWCIVTVLFQFCLRCLFQILLLWMLEKVTVAFALILWYKLQYFGYEKHYLESIILACQLLCSLQHSQ